MGVGVEHRRTPVINIADDLHVRIVHAATGELLRELTIDPSRNYQPLGRLDTSPVEVLSRRGTDTVADQWRRAATTIVIGNHDLYARIRHGITTAGTWHLLRDAARAVEVFLILDDRLDRAGVLDDHQHPKTAWRFARPPRHRRDHRPRGQASWSATDP